MKKQQLTLALAAILTSTLGSAVYAQTADVAANAKVEVQQPNSTVTLGQSLKNTAKQVHEDASHAGHAVVNGAVTATTATQHTAQKGLETTTVKLSDLETRGTGYIEESKNAAAQQKAAVDAKVASKKAQLAAQQAAQAKASAERKAKAQAALKAKQDKVNAKLAQAKSAQVGANVSVNTSASKAGVQVDAGVKAGATKN